jgi:hypothetical protein
MMSHASQSGVVPVSIRSSVLPERRKAFKKCATDDVTNRTDDGKSSQLRKIASSQKSPSRTSSLRADDHKTVLIRLSRNLRKIKSLGSLDLVDKHSNGHEKLRLVHNNATLVARSKLSKFVGRRVGGENSLVLVDPEDSTETARMEETARHSDDETAFFVHEISGGVEERSIRAHRRGRSLPRTTSFYLMMDAVKLTKETKEERFLNEGSLTSFCYLPESPEKDEKRQDKMDEVPSQVESTKSFNFLMEASNLTNDTKEECMSNEGSLKSHWDLFESLDTEEMLLDEANEASSCAKSTPPSRASNSQVSLVCGMEGKIMAEVKVECGVQPRCCALISDD